MPESPRQWGESVGIPPIIHGAYRLIPRAGISLRARVLSRRDYPRDPLGDLVPTDFALGWGRMSDSRVLQGLQIHQAERAYSWAGDHLPIPRAEIESHSANMHLIAASAEIARALQTLHVGDTLRLAGLLVDIEAPDGRLWQTSLSREDTGPGACEIVNVETLSVE